MLWEDDPLSKSIKDPREYRYFRLLKFTMKLFGGWPGRALKEGTTRAENIPLYFVTTFKISNVTLMIWYLKENTSKLSFYEIGHTYITIFMTFVTLFRALTLPLNPKFQQLMVTYITKWHLFYFKDDSEIAKKSHVSVHRLSHFIAVFLKAQLVVGSSLFNIIPIYTNYTAGRFKSTYLVNDTYELSIYYKVPYALIHRLDGYIFLLVVNWYSSYICSNFFCMFDLCMSLMIFTVSGHFKILIYNLNKFPLPAGVLGSNKGSETKTEMILSKTQMYSEAEEKDVTLRLNRCVDYHRDLIEFTEAISDVFGPMLFVYYIFIQVSGCLLLLECSQMDVNALVRYGVLTLVLFQQLIQVSVIVESVGTVTGLMKDAVYSVPWEYMSTKNRKTISIFLMNVQEPVHINALGLAKVGVQSMAAILKTSFSYFAFLRTVST